MIPETTETPQKADCPSATCSSSSESPENDNMKTLIIATTIAAASIFAAIKAGYRNVDTTKAAAPQTWSAAGYEIKGYEGYQWSPIGGGNVWYIVTRKESPGITYHGLLQKWGGEYHIYNLRAIDAIGPQ